MKTVALWFDGGGVHGYGNVRRSLELAERLGRQGLAIRLCPLSSEAARLAGLPAGGAPRGGDVVLLDVPYVGDAWLDRARTGGARVLALDYAGATAPDLVVSLQAVRVLPPATRHVVGLEYAVIRSELTARASASLSSGPVLLMLGGGAAAGVTERIAQKISTLAGDVVLVQGPLAETPAALPANVRIMHAPADLAGLMANCAWAVTTGGTSLLELLHLGRAVHALPRTPEEQSFAAMIAAQDGLLGVGEESLQTPTAAQRERCARMGPRLVDGRGCERIAELLKNLP